MWSVVLTEDGPLLQIDTFGSDNRVSDQKVSQTIQIDRGTAKQLKETLEETFPGL